MVVVFKRERTPPLCAQNTLYDILVINNKERIGVYCAAGYRGPSSLS
jgi:hypothetical protein